MGKAVRCQICNRAIKDGDAVVFRHGDLFHASCGNAPSPPTDAKNSGRRRRSSRRRS